MVLVCVSDKEFGKALGDELEKNDRKNTIVYNSKDAEYEISKKQYRAVLLGMHASDHQGIDLLKYIKLNKPSLKVIIVLNSHQDLHDLDMTKEQLINLGAIEVILKDEALGFLLQYLDSLLDGNLIKNAEMKEEKVVANDLDFSSISIDDFYSENILMFDLYVRLSKNKYIKVFNRFEYFSVESIKHYARKGVDKLYLKEKDRLIYIQNINLQLKKVLKKNQALSRKSAHMIKGLVDSYAEEIYFNGLKEETLIEGKELCENIYLALRRESGIKVLLENFENMDVNSNTHIFLTAIFSSIISKNLSWTGKITEKYLIEGSLLHDLGMLKISDSARKVNIEENEKKQSFEMIEYKKHPSLSFEMLRPFSFISEQVKQIVYQHHEQVNGTGFPLGLSGIKIFPLAKIICFASDFSKCIIRRKSTPMQTLKSVIHDSNFISKYDPECIEAFIKGFN